MTNPGWATAPSRGGVIPAGTGKHSGRERPEDASGAKRCRSAVSCVTQNGSPVNGIVFRCRDRMGLNFRGRQEPYCSKIQFWYSPLRMRSIQAGWSRYHATVLRKPVAKDSRGDHLSAACNLPKSMA